MKLCDTLLSVNPDAEHSASDETLRFQEGLSLVPFDMLADVR